MSQLDVYYRAFKEYRKATLEDVECLRSRKAVMAANPEADRLEATKYLCDIEEDWVIAIEKGLVFVEKAVEEERQFIRQNGEVVPIEKVKKISKDSVVHLAKHSEMITHVPEEDSHSEVLPDKLYMVERLSDYAVYENRFLYMLLCYLKSFINYRLDKIEELRRAYAGYFAFSKEVQMPKRMLSIKTELHDERTDNPYPVADEKSLLILRRIKDCQQIVDALLGTDLMTQVAKTPLIKPPIVKTNVLKMNNNFKQALALYDYVATYKGDGYSYKEVKYTLTPLAEKVADELAELANMATFLAYKYGNDLDEVLETAYREEEERRKEAEEQRQLARLARLKKAALESHASLEEYMVALEERNRALEKGNEQRIALRHKIETLHKNIDVLVREKNELIRRTDELSEEVEKQAAEIDLLHQKYDEDMAALERKHERELDEREQKVAAMYTGEADRVRAAVTEEYDGKIYALEQQMEELSTQHAAAVEQYEQDALIGKEKLTDARRDFAEKTASYEAETAKLREDNLNLRTELDGLRAKSGYLKPSSEYTSRERFLELEDEFEAFIRFFRGQWKVTKRAIRRDVLWKKHNAATPLDPQEGQPKTGEEG